MFKVSKLQFFVIIGYYNNTNITTTLITSYTLKLSNKLISKISYKIPIKIIKYQTHPQAQLNTYEYPKQI